MKSTIAANPEYTFFIMSVLPEQLVEYDQKQQQKNSLT